MFIVNITIKNYSVDENQIKNLIFFIVHHHHSTSYSKVQHLFAKIWHGHGCSGHATSDGLVL